MPNDEKARVLKEPGGEAGFKARSSSVQMNGSETNFIHSNEFCTYINGPISFTGNPKNNLVAGLWRPKSPFIQMFPSSIVTPIPQLIFEPPLSSVGVLVDALNIFKGFLI